MRKLELKYKVSNLSVLYEEATVCWESAEFTFSSNFTAVLKLWEDEIEPEQISETWQKLKQRAESFRIAFKYIGNHKIDIVAEEPPTYYFNEEQFTPRTEEEIAIITDYIRGRRDSFAMMYAISPGLHVTATITSSPVRLPENMPTVPSNLYRIAETIVAAEELVNYPDLVLKLAYIVIEELKGKNALNDEDLKILYVRNFVSHAVCHNTSVVALVESELPAAKVADGVQFNRNDSDHMSFVAKYAHPALQKAKELFSSKVRTEGGFLKG